MPDGTPLAVKDDSNIDDVFNLATDVKVEQEVPKSDEQPDVKDKHVTKKRVHNDYLSLRELEEEYKKIKQARYEYGKTLSEKELEALLE